MTIAKMVSLFSIVIYSFERWYLVPTFKPRLLCLAPHLHGADKKACPSFGSSNKHEGEGPLPCRPCYCNHSGFGFSSASYVKQPQLTCHFLLR